MSHVSWFYSQFIRRGDLVFDIGANVGDRTAVFDGLGARVIAVEALPGAVEHLNQRFPDGRVKVLHYAVGEVPLRGTKRIHWPTDNSKCSIASVSTEWIERAGAVYGEIMKWNEATEVPAITLDELISLYGEPRFIKIDTEGSEDTILQGLTQGVEALSFEFHPWDMPKILRCFLVLQKCQIYKYNFSWCESLTMTFPNWVSYDEVYDYIKRVEGDKVLYGDIYATLC
jgi:FkbM family methyltransferase